MKKDRTSTGIDALSFHVPGQHLPLSTLAEARGVDPAKYRDGIGQHDMSVPSFDEDIITMAAEAALPVLEGVDLESLDSVILATESGVDQSKAGAVYIHRLLNLPPRCKAFEVKQACCSSTAALQMALATVELRPERRILVIASDIARYGLNSPGEPTQGAGAVAMLISARPRLIAMDPESGSYTKDVMDFWRPNYMDEAMVDGKYSIKIYLDSLKHALAEYQRQSGRGIDDFFRFCYHLPFTRMADKAHKHVMKQFDAELDPAQLEAGLDYGRRVGNCYTASLYLSLLSLLENDPADLSGQRVGLFSYGSGSMGTFFSGVIQSDYRRHLHCELHHRMLADRIPLDMNRYEELYCFELPQNGERHPTPHMKTGRFRWAGVDGHRRIYEDRLETGRQSLDSTSTKHLVEA